MLHRKHSVRTVFEIDFPSRRDAGSDFVNQYERRGIARDAPSGVAGGCITNKSHRDSKG
jgi:hypothetical protein